MKRLTTKGFIERARKVHGNKYDYSKVEFINTRTKVCIVCPIHGDFFQVPKDHTSGKGCIKCGMMRTTELRKNRPIIDARTIKFGKGINDYPHPIIDTNGDILISYQKWCSMLARCYSKKYQKSGQSYKGCFVCDEWLLFSNFKRWFDDNYIEGCQLDKDILVKGNKVYSPQTCCFVPQRLNSIILYSKNKRGNFPIGVSQNKKRFVAHCSCGKEQYYIGSFRTQKEAFEAYKKKKLEIIAQEASYYYSQGLIKENVYQALIHYDININD